MELTKQIIRETINELLNEGAGRKYTTPSAVCERLTHKGHVATSGNAHKPIEAVRSQVMEVAYMSYHVETRGNVKRICY